MPFGWVGWAPALSSFFHNLPRAKSKPSQFPPIYPWMVICVQPIHIHRTCASHPLNCPIVKRYVSHVHEQSTHVHYKPHTRCWSISSLDKGTGVHFPSMQNIRRRLLFAEVGCYHIPSETDSWFGQYHVTCAYWLENSHERPVYPRRTDSIWRCKYALRSLNRRGAACTPGHPRPWRPKGWSKRSTDWHQLMRLLK